MNAPSFDPRGVVLDHWGEDAPDWVIALADACADRSQTAVARQIGFSSTTISQIMRKKYDASMDSIAAAVKGAFLGSHISCPILGEIARDKCVNEQRRITPGSSPVSIRLHRACRSGCPFSFIKTK